VARWFFETTFTILSNPDTTPPACSLISFTPNPVSAATGQLMTLTAHCTDAVAGVAAIEDIVFEDSSSTVSTTTYSFSEAFYEFDLETSLLNGTINDGFFQVTLVWPFWTTSSTWTIQTISVFDAAANKISYNSADFTTHGWGKSVQVVGLTGPNVTPPTVMSLALSPLAIDITNSEQTITLTIVFAGNQTQGMEGTVYFSTTAGSAISLSIDGSEAGSRAWDASTSTLTRTYYIQPASMVPATYVLSAARFIDHSSNAMFYGQLSSACTTVAATVTYISLILLSMLASL